MTTKEYLKRYRETKRALKYYDQKIAEGETPDGLLLVYEHLIKLITNIEHEVNRLSDPTEQLLIRLRYLDGYSWTKIGFTMHYSKTQLQRIHKRALEHLEQSGAVVE